ncbi:MAG: flavin reductase family protein [Anaerolineae bacterium]
MAKRIVEKEIAHRLLGGAPVVLIGSRYRQRINVMAASWITPVSMNPPMLVVSIHKGSLTHDFIERSGEFSVNIPGLPLLERVRDSGLISGRDVDDKFHETGLEPLAGEALDAPLVQGCLGHLECTVLDAYDAGEEHTLFMAEVVAAQADEEAFTETWLLTEDEAKPLHHLGGHVYALLDKPISAEPRSVEEAE